jgi:hypothetical protein
MKKLKSLALILRSLPPKSQKAIFEQLPLPIVHKISEIDLSIDEQLTQEDWEYFRKSWPEFSSLLEKVKDESKTEKSTILMNTERSLVREYLEYKLGRRKDRPNLSKAIAKIIDEVALSYH